MTVGVDGPHKRVECGPRPDNARLAHSHHPSGLGDMIATMKRAGQAAVALVLLFSGSVASAAGAGPDAADESAELRREAFELAYNLDYDEAVAVLDRAIARDPANPANQRALAAVTWLGTLYRRGAVIF